MRLSLALSVGLIVGYILGRLSKPTLVNQGGRVISNVDASQSIVQVVKTPSSHRSLEAARIPQVGRDSRLPVNIEDSAKLDKTNLVLTTAAEASAEYDRVLADSGLDSTQVASVKDMLVGLHHSTISAGDHMFDLLSSRAKYDETIKQLMSPEAYRNYRNYEASKPAKREYDEIDRNRRKANAPIPDEYRDKIVSLIKEVGATSSETSHGPYDPPPMPALGQDAMAKLRSETEALAPKANELLSRMQREGLPDEVIEGIRSYYLGILDDRVKMLNYAMKPDDFSASRIIEMINRGAIKPKP